jgi:hypothetical protein
MYFYVATLGPPLGVVLGVLALWLFQLVPCSA